MPEIEKELKRPKKPAPHFIDLDGNPLDMSGVKKLYKDTLVHHVGVKFDPDKKKADVAYAPANPLGDKLLAPGPTSPLCGACGLFEHKCDYPYMPYVGPEEPLITVIVDSVSGREDMKGEMAADGPANLIRNFIDAYAETTGVTSADVRFTALTRCAHRLKGKNVNYKSKGEYCRLFLVQDLRRYRPKIIFAVGTAVLGHLSHKSNAQDWGGKVLTWRGWPDDWLTNPDYMMPQLAAPGKVPVIGHPIFGQPPGPEEHIVLYPLQAPRLVYGTQNQLVIDRWKRQVLAGLKMARGGVKAKDYDLPYFRILEDPDTIEDELRYLIDRPEIVVAYDTETTGLRPWLKQKIVFMMFRYNHPDTGEPVAFGFPWDYAESPIYPHVRRLTPFVVRALQSCKVVGHNLTFDILFTTVTLGDPSEYAAVDEFGRIRPEWKSAQERLNALADAGFCDTWHMAYCFQQQRESLGLELLAYRHVPEMAGYEEEMTLLIDLMSDRLHPENGGHYANCPRDKWESHLKPYVMGDVEVAYKARDALQEKLDTAKTYRIPLANPDRRTPFRYFSPPGRAWIYSTIMAPASSTLTKMMGRGMFIDQAMLKQLEVEMPKQIGDLRDKMGQITPKVEFWLKGMLEGDPNNNDPDKRKHWELDLDNKSQLREILFKLLNLPVQRLTKTGKKFYGEEPEHWNTKIREALKTRTPDITEHDLKLQTEAELLKYAAMDKFTLNKLSVDHEEVRPLQDYRKIHKQYATYVRPLRNILSVGIDKKAREQDQHLCPDGMIHAQFMLTGTRGGRLSCRNPNLQNLPKKGDVKRLYTSRFGDAGCLYGADFSQIELRLLAVACGDQSMINAYLNDMDLHSLTASRIFKVPYDNFSKDNFKRLEQADDTKGAKELKLKRDIAKTCNFLTGYGGGAFGLQNVLANNQVYRPLEYCEGVIEAFFEAYPALKEHLQYYKRFIMDHQVAVSIFGRVRVFEEILSEDNEAKSKAARAGYNHLIQSTASDMLLVCLVVIESLMRQESLESILVSTVHDSLVIDALRKELPKVHEIVDYVLNNVPEVFKAYFGEDYDTSWMLVPFAGDCELGFNYLDMVGIPRKDPDWDKLLASAA